MAWVYKMKQCGRSWHLFLIFLCIPQIVSAGNHDGKIHFKGAVIDAACSIDSKTFEQVVTMGKISKAKFKHVGAWTSQVDFHIRLTDCDTSVFQQVGIGFDGLQDGKDPLVFAVGSGAGVADGVGLGIFDHEGKLIPPNAAPRSFQYLNDGTNILTFSARYRSSSPDIEPGKSNANITFRLEYL